MLGLAVGIDYALFIVARHQDQVRAGVDPEESAARATGTAGSAVVFAGVTVLIALIGLDLRRHPVPDHDGHRRRRRGRDRRGRRGHPHPALLGFAKGRVVGWSAPRSAAGGRERADVEPARRGRTPGRCRERRDRTEPRRSAARRVRRPLGERRHAASDRHHGRRRRRPRACSRSPPRACALALPNAGMQPEDERGAPGVRPRRPSTSAPASTGRSS